MDLDVVGKLGRVVVRVRGLERPGEVTVSVRGATETFIAYSDSLINRGEPVLILSSRGNRSVDVAPVDELRLPPRPAVAERD